MTGGLVLTDAILSAVVKNKYGQVNEYITANDNSGKIYPLHVGQNHNFFMSYLKKNGFNGSLPNETFPCVCLHELKIPMELYKGYKGALITPPELEKIEINMIIPDAKVIGTCIKGREYVLFSSEKLGHKIILLYGLGDNYGKPGFFNPEKDRIRDFVEDNRDTVYCIKVKEILYKKHNGNMKKELLGSIVHKTTDEKVIQENIESLDKLLDRTKNPDIWWNRDN